MNSGRDSREYQSLVAATGRPQRDWVAEREIGRGCGRRQGSRQKKLERDILGRRRKGGHRSSE